MATSIEQGRAAVQEEGLSPFERLRQRMSGTLSKAGPPPQAIQAGPPPGGAPQGPPPEAEDDEDEDPKKQRPGAPVAPQEDDDADADGDGEEEGDQEYGDEDKDDDGVEDDAESPDEDEDEDGEDDEDEEDEGDGQPNPPPPPAPTRKSEAVDEALWDSYGDPDSDYLRGLEKSEHASTIDASPALIHAVEVMGRIVSEAKRIAVIESERADGLAKSVEELTGKLEAIQGNIEALGGAALKSLRNQEAQEARIVAQATLIDTLTKSLGTFQDTLAKSLDGITQGVELIKSQPAGTTGHGLNGFRYPNLGDARPPAERPPVTVSKINDAIFKSVAEEKITGEEASHWLASLNGEGGAAAAFERMPQSIKDNLR